ncbi:hypothetical protein ACTXT7_002166 [Hymenolepis weldensis]
MTALETNTDIVLRRFVSHRFARILFTTPIFSSFLKSPTLIEKKMNMLKHFDNVYSTVFTSTVTPLGSTDPGVMKKNETMVSEN